MTLRTLRRAAAVTVILSAGAMTGAVSGATAHTPGSEAGAAPAAVAAADSTALTIKVVGCGDDCSLLVQRFEAHGEPGRGTAENIADVAVVDGKATFTVPTDKANQLAFNVHSPRDQANFVTFAVARYKGKKPGAKVPDKFAAKAKAGMFCWAGTTADQATLRMRVTYYKVRNWYDPDGPKLTLLRAYFTPTLRSIGKFDDHVFHGSLGTQQAVTCDGG